MHSRVPEHGKCHITQALTYACSSSIAPPELSTCAQVASAVELHLSTGRVRADSVLCGEALKAGIVVVITGSY